MGNAHEDGADCDIKENIFLAFGIIVIVVDAASELSMMPRNEYTLGSVLVMFSRRLICVDERIECSEGNADSGVAQPQRTEFGADLLASLFESEEGPVAPIGCWGRRLHVLYEKRWHVLKVRIHLLAEVIDAVPEFCSTCQ